MTPWTAAHQAPLSSTIPWSLLIIVSIGSVMLSNCLILSCPLPLAFSLSQLKVFCNEMALCIRWPKSWSFSFSPSNEYSGLFPLVLMACISLQSKGLSGVFPAPQIESTNSLVLSRLYGPTREAINDYWKNHSFNYMDLCRQDDVSAF